MKTLFSVLREANSSTYGLLVAISLNASLFKCSCFYLMLECGTCNLFLSFWEGGGVFFVFFFLVSE